MSSKISNNKMSWDLQALLCGKGDTGEGNGVAGDQAGK